MTAITVPRTTAAKASFLRFAIRLDAVISGLMGIVGVPFAHQIAEMSGSTPSFEYSVGAFFIAYGVTLYVLAAAPAIRRIGAGIIAANVVFAIVALAVLAAGVLPLTAMGVAMMLATIASTLGFAYLQYLGVRRLA